MTPSLLTQLVEDERRRTARRRGVDRPVDGRQRILALLAPFHIQHQADRQEVVAHQPLFAKDIGAVTKLPELVDLRGRGIESGAGTAEHRQGGVGDDVRDRTERALDAIDRSITAGDKGSLVSTRKMAKFARAEHALELPTRPFRNKINVVRVASAAARPASALGSDHEAEDSGLDGPFEELKRRSHINAAAQAADQAADFYRGFAPGCRSPSPAIPTNENDELGNGLSGVLSVNRLLQKTTGTDLAHGLVCLVTPRSNTMTTIHAKRARLVVSPHAVRVFSPTPTSPLNFRAQGESWERRVEHGKRLCKTTPLESHAGWTPPRGRPDPVATMLASDAGRQEHLLPLHHGRMAASPFGFLRGAAAVMAWDLSHTPNIGLPLIICGDCHVNNFGLYGTPQGDVVVDINDFDEVAIGPWEWDLKRLTASVNVLGRENGLTAKERRVAVRMCAAGYRANMQRFQSVGILDLWFLHTIPDRLPIAMLERLYPKAAKLWPKAEPVLAKAVAKARKTDNAMLLRKTADRSVDGGWRFREDPPILTPVDADTREKVIDALNAYTETVAPERSYMLRRYHVVDVAHRVVGVGSVGTRAYLTLLFGNSDADPLFLQVKEAETPAHAPYLPPLPPQSPAAKHQGRRVVSGQVVLQAAHDPLLGWTEIDGRPYYVRLMKNMKGAIPMGYLSGDAFNFFVFGFGAVLARAHARSGDAAVIAGYCGTSTVLDEALADWAEAYGEQTLQDHAALVRAIKSGRVEAQDEG